MVPCHGTSRQLRAILDPKPDHGLSSFMLVCDGDGKALELLKDEPSQGCPRYDTVNID